MPIYRWFRPALAALCLVAWAGVAAQQPPAPTPAPLSPGAMSRPTGRVGFVDLEIVLDKSRSVRTIVTEVDTDLGEQSRQIDLKTVEVQKIRRDLEQKSAVLSEAQRQQRQQKASDLLREIEEMEYRFRRAVRDKQRTTIEPLLEQVIRLTGDVARREGYDLVVRGEVVLYGHDRVDLTPMVIQELDNRLDDVRRAVEKPAPAPAEPIPAATATTAAPAP